MSISAASAQPAVRQHTPALQSRLPNVGTTIFTVMSALATEKNAVNLGQGFPDFGCDPRLQALVTEAMRAGHNQYAPMPGVARLREALADCADSLDAVAGDMPTAKATATRSIVKRARALLNGTGTAPG